MCQCMQEIEDKLKSAPIEALKGRPVAKVEWEFPQQAWIGTEMREALIAIVKVYPEGQKKAIGLPIELCFCPFCGKKF